MGGGPQADDLIDEIYEASVDETRWHGALASIRRAVDGDAAALYTQNPTQTYGRMSGAELAFTDGYDPYYLEAYFQHYYKLNPFLRSAHRFALGQVATDEDLPNFADGMRLEGGEFHADWCRPQRLDHVIGAFTHVLEDGILSIAIWRSGRRYAESEIDRFAGIERHVVRALNIGEHFRSARQALDFTQGAAEHLGVGVITLDRHGRVRTVNGRAEDALVAGDGLSVRDGRLRANFLVDQAALESCLKAVVGSASEDKEAPKVTVRRKNGKAPLSLVLLAPGERVGRFAPDALAACIVLVHGLGLPVRLDPDGLRQQFGLTLAEARLTSELGAGEGLRTAASRLGIGYETARTQLKSIFLKTNTHRQTELVAKLNAM